MKRILVGTVVVVLIVASFVAGFTYSNYIIKKNQSIGEAQNAEYEKEFLSISSLIMENTVTAGLVVDVISSTWSTAIQGGDDFNKAIKDFMEKSKSILETMAKTDEKITIGMQKLKNYPIQYQEAYNVLLETHGVYSQIYSQANSPSGSLMSFNNKMNDLQSEFVKISSKLKIYMPKLKESATAK